MKRNLLSLHKFFSETECKFLKGKPIFGIRLHKMQGLLGKELQPNRRFGTELAGYVKSKAGLRGILHSDELPAYGVSEREIENVKHKCNCVMNDGFAIVQGNKEKAKKAVDAIVERCKQAISGVPEETRNALEDANTEYSRPLPGAARMYPETDLTPVSLEAKELSSIGKNLPLTVKGREKLYAKNGLSGKFVDGMKLSNYACFFERLLAKGVNATTAASVLLDNLTQLRREGIANISNEMVEQALMLEKNKKISKDILLDFLKEWSKKPELEAEDILAGMSIERVDDSALRKTIIAVIEKNKDTVDSKGMHAVDALMGDAMKELKGKADGSAISKILKEEIGKRAKK